MRARSTPLVVFALFAALTLAWSWPLPTELASRIAFDPGDPFLNAWILWWNAQATPFSREWWSPPIFYPMTGGLALSEHLAGIAIFTTPLIHLGATPALAYNVALLLSCTLSGFFTYLLVRRLSGSEGAAICAGLAYAFAPFRAGQLSHLQVLTSQWLPLALLGLHGYIEHGRRRWLVLFGVAWVIQSLSNGHYLLFAPALFASWMAWFTVRPRRWRQAIEIVVAWGVSSLALLPVLIEYHAVHRALGLSRPLSEIVVFSGRPSSFLNPAPMLAFWPPRPARTVEDFLFPGLTIVLVILVALPLALRRRAPDGAARATRSAFVFYVLAAVLMAAMTLGPAPPGAGLAGWLKPYQWLMLLPGFDGIRVPVRFAMLMALCLAIGGGLGLAAVAPARRVWRRAILVIVACGLSIDGAIESLTGSPPPGRVELPLVPAATVLELPPHDAAVNVGAMFRAMSHRLPLVNGYSGHTPRHYEILSQSLRRFDPSALIELARGRTLLLLIAERNDPGGSLRRLIESIPGIERGIVTGAGMSYVLRAQPTLRRPRGGTPHTFRASREPGEHAVLDLGSTRVIRSLEFAARNRYRSVGRRMAVEVSDDGTKWVHAWEDWTAGAALAGALEDQVLVPVRLLLPDITTRYLRIHPMQDWILDQLKVLGP
ncbi:MAG: hypothetical protein ACRD1U_09930 [Vicinamibacterales bacterium]